jgi:hypothetical protein
LIKPDAKFFRHESGVYEASAEDSRAAYEGVKLLGWGIDFDYTPPMDYWLAQRSWGADNGLFRIRRGTNTAEVESFILGLTPAELDAPPAAPPLAN